MAPVLVNGRPVDYDRLPNRRMRDAVEEYVERGWIDPADFLYALCSNDLQRTCAVADDVNRRLVFEWMSWLHNCAPSQCFGSPERVRAWVALCRGEIE